MFGGAYGAACEVVSACDLRFAAADARFAIPAGKLSVIYDAAGIARLVARASATLVAELLYTARPMPAARARELGFVNGLHPASELEHEVMTLAREIAGLAPRTLTATKQMLHALRAGRGFSDVEVAHFTRLRNEALASDDFAGGAARVRREAGAEVRLASYLLDGTWFKPDDCLEKIRHQGAVRTSCPARSTPSPLGTQASRSTRIQRARPLRLLRRWRAVRTWQARGPRRRVHGKRSGNR